MVPTREGKKGASAARVECRGRGRDAGRRDACLRLALLALILPWHAFSLPGAAADLEAGRAVVVGGEEGTITPCFMCHGLDGVGDSAGAFPRLTGQAAFYMYKQLVDYASGARPNDVMSPIADQMTEPQMADVAYYYSELSAPFTPRPKVEPDVIERGRQIAEEGLPESDLPACRHAISVTARTARAIRRCSPTLPDSTRPTRSCSCSCGSKASAETMRSTSWRTSPRR